MKKYAADTAIENLDNRKYGDWVQVQRNAFEAWASLIDRKPRAAKLMTHLIANMGNQNAVVISQKTLSKLMGCGLRTVQYAISELVLEKWIQVVKLNGPGTVSAYVVNDRVAWAQPRKQLRLSMFSAAIVADYDDQDRNTLEHSDLRQLPALYPRERQLPTGAGEPPPIQPSLDGLAPDLPSLEA